MHEYEVCLSFAGQDRKIAQALARELVDMSVTVFFDEFDSHQLLGENLVEYLTSVYSIKARYCVIIASEGYASRKWTKNIELPAAQSRLLEQGSGYIIPLIVDDTNIPGILSSCGHIDLRKKSVEEAAYQIGKKGTGWTIYTK